MKYWLGIFLASAFAGLAEGAIYEVGQGGPMPPSEQHHCPPCSRGIRFASTPARHLIRKSLYSAAKVLPRLRLRSAEYRALGANFRLSKGLAR